MSPDRALQIMFRCVHKPNTHKHTRECNAYILTSLGTSSGLSDDGLSAWPVCPYSLMSTATTATALPLACQIVSRTCTLRVTALLLPHRILLHERVHTFKKTKAHTHTRSTYYTSRANSHTATGARGIVLAVLWRCSNAIDANATGTATAYTYIYMQHEIVEIQSTRTTATHNIHLKIHTRGERGARVVAWSLLNKS